MRLPALPILGVVFLLACGGAAGGSGPGGSGDTGGAGGTGGNGGVDPSFTEVDDCIPYEVEQATDHDPFALLGVVGAELPVGTDALAAVMGFDEALTRIDFWSDALGHGFSVNWPRAESMFVVGEVLRVRRTTDWLTLRSTVNETLAVLHVSTGAAPPAAALEAVPDGPTLRFVPQCGLPADGACRSYALAVEATDGEETQVMLDGYPWGFHGSRWNIQPITALRVGCGEDGYAAVIVGDGLLWY
jgi:hypothetical protein